MAKVLINLPPDLLELIDHAAKVEHQNRSEFARAALLKACREVRHEQSKYKQFGTETESKTAKKLDEDEDYYL